MPGKVFLFLFTFLILFSFSPQPPEPVSIEGIRIAYARAEKFYNSPESTVTTDRAAMSGFKNLILGMESMPRVREIDSLIFESAFRFGILCEVYKDYKQATAYYLKAMNHGIDSIGRYRMMIFAGAGYYNQNYFDSASYYLLKTAEHTNLIHASEDRMRLFNTLGVLYNDNGNYLQSKNYFIQALRLSEGNSVAGRLNAYSLQLNLGTCYMKLGFYKQALVIYQKALSYHILPDPLYLNQGRAYAGLQLYDSALASFKKVNAEKIPGVFNEIAKTEMDRKRFVSAEENLLRYQTIAKIVHTNTLDNAANAMYSGDLELLRSHPDKALEYLQKALIIFSGNYQDQNPRSNPSAFVGSFAYYRLFEVLEKKAAAWKMKFVQTGNPSDLLAAFETFQANMKLLDYIERSYETDDAKLLLKQKSGELFSNAMNVCLQLNQLFPGKGYLEKAFFISESNKASVMSSQIRERNGLKFSTNDNAYTIEERNIKFKIARLINHGGEKDDENSRQESSRLRSEFETELVNLHKKMENDKRFYHLRYTNDFPTIGELQRHLRGDEALLSFFNTTGQIIIFVLDHSSFKFQQLDSGIAIRNDVETWIHNLQNPEMVNRTETRLLKKRLYEKLSTQILKLAGNKKEWIVVPDDVFFQLPLESLPANLEAGLLLDEHAMSYEFSSRTILEEGSLSPMQQPDLTTMSFAPFSKTGMDLKREGMGDLQKLPFSGEEIAHLTGGRYLDSFAKKSVFIHQLRNYPIIHLATHAVTDMRDPSASFIAFAPSQKFKSDDFLYLDEIYALEMDHCQMMVISACETGKGELIRNEGAMSFARAFLYAGCPSTINTLWKADDYSTAKILEYFYSNLRKGDTKSRALQKAKLEYIKNNSVRRNPSYWSHIILTGNPAALYSTERHWIWYVAGVFLLTGLVLLIWRKWSVNARG